jgi:N-methylhydantoinase A
MPVECLHWRVGAVGASRRWPRASANGLVGSAPTPVRTGQAFFAAAGGLVQTPAYAVEELTVGVKLEGPALVMAPTTTIVLHPGDTLTRPTIDGFLIDARPRS